MFLSSVDRYKLSTKVPKEEKKLSLCPVMRYAPDFNASPEE
jgi:hypothetical protein